MPKKTNESLEAALLTDESFSKSEQEMEVRQTLPPDDRIVTVSIMLRESVIAAIDDYVYKRKRKGERGFSRSKVFQDLAAEFISKNNLS
jgi:hypothetical protein